jgi:hypothetical protein
MPVWSRIADVVVAVAATALITTAITDRIANATQTAGRPSGQPAAAQDASALLPRAGLAAPAYQPSTEPVFTTMKPCRVADTSAGGGNLAAGTSRDFHVSDTTNLSSQGGPAAGCGIPASATAISAYVTGSGIGGTGFLRAWPTGLTANVVTILYYSASPAYSLNQATLPLNTGKITIGANSRAARVIINVTGYHSPPLAGFISPSGTPYSGSSRIIDGTRTGVGTYEVTFDRNIRYCAATATPYVSAYYASVSTWFDSTRPSTLRISMWDANGTAVDQYVYVEVQC